MAVLDPETDPRVSRALASSFPEGALAQVAGSINDHYLAPCALFLGATASQVGWLAAAPKLAGALAQAGSLQAVRVAGDRRRVLVAGALLQGFVLVPIAVAALRPGRAGLAALFAAAAAFQLLGGLMYPAWASLMSEYLPAERRAGFFGRRNRVLAACGLATLAFWGLVLDRVGPLRSGAAFAALFACAAACRAASTHWMARLAPRPLRPPLQTRLSWTARLDGLLGRLIAYTACAAFATQLGDVMQPVRLLSELRCGYGEFMAVRLAGGLGAVFTAAWWGRRADLHGRVPVLRAAGFLMAFSPLAWALTRRVAVLAAVEVVDGAAGAGFALCAVAHLFDAAAEGERLQAIGAFTLAGGAALFGAAGLSGALAGLGVPLRVLFSAACALRLAVEFLLGRRLINKVSDIHEFTKGPGWPRKMP